MTILEEEKTGSKHLKTIFYLFMLTKEQKLILLLNLENSVNKRKSPVKTVCYIYLSKYIVLIIN
jgi:hypothetical protein